jgi:hypothetical protein
MHTTREGRWGNSHQVTNLCAELHLGCMAVSRFFFFPIQNNFSEIQKVALIPLSRVLRPSGVVGYMRKQRFERIEATSPLVNSKQLQKLVGSSPLSSAPIGEWHSGLAR